MEFQLYSEQENLEKELQKFSKTKNSKEIMIIQKELKKNFTNFIFKCLQLIEQAQKINEDNNFFQQEQLLIANLDLVSMLLKKYKIYFTSQQFFIYELIILYTKTYFFSNSFLNIKINNRKKIRENFFDCSEKLQEMIEEHYNFSDENFYSHESSLMPYEHQQFGKKTFESINMCLFLQEIHLVRAVLNSTISCNQLALEQALEGYQLSQKLIKSISHVLNLIIIIGPENLKNFNFISKKNFINIKKYIEFIKKQKLPESQHEYKWEPESSDWKYSKNNLSKFLEKKIRSNSNFEFLVDKFRDDKISKFSIADISKLISPLKLIQILEDPQFDQDFILKTIITYSCNFYCIAAEHRTISKNILKNKSIEQKAFALFNDKLTIASKNFIKNEFDKEQLIKNKGFNLSKEVHEKALEIILFGFSNRIYLVDYFMQKYRINYCTISTIPEVEEPSRSPTKYSRSNYQCFDEESISQHQEQINVLKNQIQEKLGYIKKESNPCFSKNKSRKSSQNQRAKTLSKKQNKTNSKGLINQHSFKHKPKKKNSLQQNFTQNQKKKLFRQSTLKRTQRKVQLTEFEEKKILLKQTKDQITTDQNKSTKKLIPFKKKFKFKSSKNKLLNN